MKNRKPPQRAMYVRLGSNDGPHLADDVCTRCGQPLNDDCVALQFDQRINEYHDFHGLLEVQSQGWFVFDPVCAELLRWRARDAIRGDIGPIYSTTSD